jgi:dihydroorotate dehydrogenase (NAD+) catalytic subunit
MLAGATAVQIGTANFINPRASEDVVDGITAYAVAQKLTSIRPLIGGLRLPSATQHSLTSIENLAK